MVTPNKKQQECIDNIEGQYLVLAGPGTGKTFTVVRRIENIINHGVEPSKILCLTFTDTAANEMKKGIDKQLGKIDSDVNVYTYHSFCNEIIKDNPREFELPDNFRLITNAVFLKLLLIHLYRVLVLGFVKTYMSSPLLKYFFSRIFLTVLLIGTIFFRPFLVFKAQIVSFTKSTQSQVRFKTSPILKPVFNDIKEMSCMYS